MTPADGAAGAAGDDLADLAGLADLADDELLRDHLLQDHRRVAHELAGLPLVSVHELEHFDDTLGLLRLRHRHGRR